MSGTAFVYVIGHAAGVQKVGFSADPWTRARTLKVAGEPHLRVNHAAAVAQADARGIEDLSHWLLDAHALGHEKFEVGPASAALAVEAAVARFASGERAPHPRPGMETVKISLNLTESTIDTVEEWRAQQRPVPNVSEAVRRLIERGAKAKP